MAALGRHEVIYCRNEELSCIQLCCYRMRGLIWFKVLYILNLKNPVESAVALTNVRVVIRDVDCRALGALGMPFAVSPDKRIRFQSYGFRDPFAAPTLGCSLSKEICF